MNWQLVSSTSPKLFSRSIAVLTTLLCGSAALQGCATQQTRVALKDQLISNAGWQSGFVSTAMFDLAAAKSTIRHGNTLIAYLEGDGRAYLSDAQASTDPTPADPTALRMALADSQARPVIYLARPCQYTLPQHGRNCEQRFWTHARYAAPIVDSISQALDAEKSRVGATRLVLVGYSGGGAIATLLAQRRSDVAGLITVAANLDLADWITRNRLAPLDESINPADAARRIDALPQLHLSGGQDHVVQPDVARAFLKKNGGDVAKQLLVIEAFDHICCWAEQWSMILKMPEVAKVMER